MGAAVFCGNDSGGIYKKGQVGEFVCALGREKLYKMTDTVKYGGSWSEAVTVKVFELLQERKGYGRVYRKKADRQ